MAAIDELRERLRALDLAQAQWNQRFAAAYERLRRERLGRFRQPDAAQAEALAADAAREAGEDQALESFAGFDALCDAYLAEPLPQNRAKLRADVGSSRALLPALWSYAAQNAELVRGSADAPRLRRGLAAVSLDDLRADVLEVDALLARLWLAAVGAGLDPRAAFADVAAVSNPGMGGGGAFMARRLGEFEGSLAWRTRVAPALKRRSA